MTVDVLVGPICAALVAVGLFVAAWIARRSGRDHEAALLADLTRPTTPVDLVAPGRELTLEGVVVADGTHPSPLSAAQTVHDEIVAHVDVADGTRTETLHAASLPFWLETPTGTRVRVEAEHARRFVIPVVFDPRDPRAPLSATQRAWAEARLRGARGAARLEERSITPGQTLRAIGSASRDDGGLVMRGSAIRLIVGSAAEHHAELALARRDARWLAAAAGAVLLVTLVWASWVLFG